MFSIVRIRLKQALNGRIPILNKKSFVTMTLPKRLLQHISGAKLFIYAICYNYMHISN